MTKLIEKALAAPVKWMESVVRKEIKHSNSSKITTDINGNAVLNMNNQEVRDAMQARMTELAAKQVVQG